MGSRKMDGATPSTVNVNCGLGRIEVTFPKGLELYKSFEFIDVARRLVLTTVGSTHQVLTALHGLAERFGSKPRVRLVRCERAA